MSDDLPNGFDVITLIYTDFCVLSPGQRKALLRRMKNMLNPKGHIVLDVAGLGLLKSKETLTLIEDKLSGGFWAKGKYVGIQKSFVYQDIKISLDRYIIIEPNEIWQMYNWFQHFTPESIKTELEEAGFVVTQIVGDLTGKKFTNNEDLIGIIASLL